MKKLLLLTFIAVAILACNEKKSYTISGNVELERLNGQTVYLGKRIENKLVSIDSTTIKDSKFTFTGNVVEPEIYYVTIGREVFEVIVENVPIEIIIGENEVTITGTELNDLISQHLKQLAAIEEKLNRIADSLIAAGVSDAELNAALDASDYNKWYEEYINSSIAFVKENINNKAGECFLSRATSQMGVEEMEELLTLASAETLQKDVFKKLSERVAIAKTVAVGQPFVDIEMPNPQGENVKLSDYAGKGKYVLVDFWASWCGPCIAEMPNLIEVYQKYKNKNFEIVGVSFDRDKEKWLNGIKEHNLTWVHMSDIKLWQSEGARLYNVNAIPHTVLIDPQGIIIEKNLRGDALKNKLAELLK